MSTTAHADLAWIDDLPLPVFVIGPGGRVRRNAALLELDGTHDPEPSLESLGLHVHETDIDLLMRATAAVLGEGKPVSLEYRWRASNTHAWRWLRATVRRVTRASIDYAVGSVEDVTQQREIAETLQHAQRLDAMGRIAAGIAHDFNNLLTIVRTCNEALRRAVGHEAELLALVSDVDGAAQRATELTSRLLAFAQKRPTEPAVIELGDVLRDLAPLVKRVAGERVRVRYRTLTRATTILIDRAQLEQIIVNLVANARDAMPDGGELFVGVAGSTSPNGALLVELSVRDDGTGMTEDVKARLFEPFFTTKGKDGTGLGLATVYGIVQQVGGTIEILSEAGRGTDVRIRFPLAVVGSAPLPTPIDGLYRPPAERESVRETKPGIDAPTRASILLVEDDALVRKATERGLRKASYDVVSAGDVGQAFDVAASRHFDYLVTDVRLPDGDGLTLARELRERRAAAGGVALPVVLVSGYSDESLDVGRLRQEGIRFVPKPFSIDDLVRAVAGKDSERP